MILKSEVYVHVCTCACVTSPGKSRVALSAKLQINSQQTDQTEFLKNVTIYTVWLLLPIDDIISMMCCYTCTIFH